MSEPIVAVILQNYLRRLMEIRSNIVDELPEDMKFEGLPEDRHIFHVFGGLSQSIPILDGLDSFILHLEEDIEILRRENE